MCSDTRWSLTRCFNLTPGHGPIKLMSSPDAKRGEQAYTDSETEFVRHLLDEFRDTHFIATAGFFAQPSLADRGTDSVICR